MNQGGHTASLMVNKNDEGFPGIQEAPPADRSPGPAAYFDEVHQAFLLAEKSFGGATGREFQIAEQKIRLRFSGPALISRLTPALDHLPRWWMGEPDLTICTWDSATTGVSIPLPPWAGGVYRARGRDFQCDEGTVHYNDGRFRMFYYKDEQAVLLDMQRGLGLFWVPDACQVPYHESGAPLRMLFHWWLSGSKRQFVHGAAVGTPEGGVLMAGKSGSGKSTSTLACLDSPLRMAGDDYCLLEISPDPRVYSIYSTAKIEPSNLKPFPALGTKMSNANRLETEKALFFIQQHFPEKLILDFPLEALLIPRITGRVNTTLEPVTIAEGLKALAPSTIVQLSGDGQSALRVLTRFVRQVPCYNLLLGTDLQQIPRTIHELLSRNQT